MEFIFGCLHTKTNSGRHIQSTRGFFAEKNSYFFFFFFPTRKVVFLMSVFCSEITNQEKTDFLGGENRALLKFSGFEELSHTIFTDFACEPVYLCTWAENAPGTCVPGTTQKTNILTRKVKMATRREKYLEKVQKIQKISTKNVLSKNTTKTSSKKNTFYFQSSVSKHPPPSKRRGQ